MYPVYFKLLVCPFTYLDIVDLSTPASLAASSILLNSLTNVSSGFNYNMIFFCYLVGVISILSGM